MKTSIEFDLENPNDLRVYILMFEAIAAVRSKTD